MSKTSENVLLGTSYAAYNRQPWLEFDRVIVSYSNLTGFSETEKTRDNFKPQILRLVICVVPAVV